MKKLAFGLMRLPVISGSDEIDIVLFKHLADLFLERGFSHFDTAYIYHGGKSEIAFKEAVAMRYPRNSFTITDKMPLFLARTPERLEEIFNEQTEKCGVSFFDYYFLHALQNGSYKQAENIGAFDFLVRKKYEGKISHIGFSFHDSPEVLDEILSKHPEIEIVLLQINYLDWNDAAVRAKECYEVAVSHGVRIMVMEPLKGGALVNVPENIQKTIKEKTSFTPARIALGFAGSLEYVDYVLSGMGSKDILISNMDFFESFDKLNPEEISLCLKIANEIKKDGRIPCSSCGYCTDCPEKIPIPKYFALYNNRLMFKKDQMASEHTYVTNLKYSGGRITDCISCGLCEERCPQHIKIREMLKMAAKELTSGK